MFQITFTCAGESGIISSGEGTPNVQAQETRNGFSVYYTIAFLPV